MPAAEIAALATRAKRASRAVATCAPGTRRRALESMAAAIEARASLVLLANRDDLAAAPELTAALSDRLRLDERRLAAVVASLREVAALDDPVGELVRTWRRPNGLLVGRMRIPLGVIAMLVMFALILHRAKESPAPAPVPAPAR